MRSAEVILLSLVISSAAPPLAAAGVVIDEIQYHPADPSLEFVEVFNPGPAPADLSGWTLSEAVRFIFPDGVILGAGGRAVVARDRTALAAAAGIDPADLLGELSGSLSDSGERLVLADTAGVEVEAIAYSNLPPWDTRADGGGPSLERICPSAGGSLPGNWRASAVSPGTPLGAGPARECPPPLPAVHSPVVVNEIHYHPKTADPAGEFIELHNRTDAPVDIHGWSLGAAVDLLFDRAKGPAMIPARGFLLVARDPAVLAPVAGIPAGAIAGPWAGKLSNFRDEIQLIDSRGSLADRVVYGQDGPWPAGADGLGPSLQRISPEISGILPQNWKAGSGSFCAGIRECALVDHAGPVRWFQSLDGLDPGFSGDRPWWDPAFDDGANGWGDGRLAVGFDFRSPGLAWIGTASSKTTGLHSILLRIEFSHDPGSCESADPHLYADWDDGFIAWLNGVEVARRGMLDPAGTAPEFDGRYRAEVVNARGVNSPEPRWQEVWAGAPGSLLPGRNVLAIGSYNCRSTSSDLYLSAKVTLGPAAGDEDLTPGRANASAAPTVPPLVVSAGHAPARPRPEDPVTVQAEVEGPDAALVEIVVDRGAGEERFPMSDDDGDGIFAGIVTPSPNLALVKYRVEARNGDGCFAAFPREGNPSPWTGYLVLASPPEESDDVRLFHIFTPGSLNDLSCADNLYVVGQLVDFRGKAHLDVGVKFRGETACMYPKKPIRVEFRKGDLLDGQEHLNFNSCWNDKAQLREKLGFDLFRKVGVLTSEAHFARVHTNGGAFHGTYFTVEDPSEAYLRRNGWDDDGALYKCRTAMLSAAVTGYEPRTDTGAERIAEVGRFAGDLNRLSGQALIDFLNSRLNVEEFLDYQAVQDIIIDGDSVVKNWLFYLGPPGTDLDGPDLAAIAPWDIDLSFGQMYLTDDVRHHDIHPLFQTQTYPFFDQGWHGIIHAVLQRAPDDYYVKAFYGRIWALLREKFDPAILFPGIEGFEAATIAAARQDAARWPRTWGTRGNDPAYWRADLKAWVGRRHAWLTAYLLGNNPTTGGRRFQYVPAPRMAFTEILYHPLGDDRFQFLEIKNLEGIDVDISGWTIPAAGWTFPAGSLAPAGGLFIVAKDPAALAGSREIPPGVPLFGPYPGALDHGESEIRLRDPGLYKGKVCYPETIDVVRYGDDPPWPAAADGGGKSLELIDPAGDNDDPGSWRESRLDGGSPGLIAVANLPPAVVLVIAPRLGAVPLTVDFDASGSHDPDGDPFTVRWEFDDAVESAGPRVTRTFHSPGTHGGKVILDDGFSPPAEERFEVRALEESEVPFRRGDANGDGGLDVADAIRILFGLFGGYPLDCRLAADVDGDGTLSVTDPLILLGHLFLSGPPPAAPFPGCGTDPAGGALGCQRAGSCE